MRFFKNRTVEADPAGLLAPDMAEIRIPEILLGEDKIWIESGRRPKFFDGAIPIAMHGMGIAQVIVRPRLVRRFPNGIRPEQQPVLIEHIPLVCKETENKGQACCQSGGSKLNNGRLLFLSRHPLLGV
jgi:hypothetical protein